MIYVLEERFMSAKEKSKDKSAKERSGTKPADEKEPVVDEAADLEAYEPASARNIPRPPTSLAVQVKGDVGKLSISLLGDISSAPALADVEKFNKKGEGESRTPLLTVIQAVLAKAGGSMQLGELAAQTRKHWHRPFPAGPYTDEELIYIIARNSDSIRVT